MRFRVPFLDPEETLFLYSGKLPCPILSPDMCLVSGPLFLAMLIGANATLGCLDVVEGGRSSSAATSHRRFH